MNFRCYLFSIFFLIFSSPLKTFGQDSVIEAGILNIGIGSLIGGVGAIINKQPQEKFGNVLINGMGKGAVGGYMIFESKRLIRNFEKTGDYSYVWPSKLINAAGSSIIENAAANRPISERWHLTLGFTRWELSTKENFKLSFRIMPLSLVGTVITATKGDFSFDRSIKTGNFVYTTDHIENKIPDTGFTSGQVTFFGSAILILNTWEGETALSHEIIHMYQNESLMGINQYLNKPLKELSQNISYYRLYSKIFYTQYNALVMGGLYNLASLGKGGYSGNFFEQEAKYFTKYYRPNSHMPSF